MECPWYDLLIEDMRTLILAHLDTVSAAMMGWSCKKEWALYDAQRNPWTRKPVPMTSMAARLGYEAVLDYCIPRDPSYQPLRCLYYALRGDERAYALIKRRWSTIIISEGPHVLALYMSWEMFQRVRPSFANADGKSLQRFIQDNWMGFADKQVLSFMLKKAWDIYFPKYIGILADIFKAAVIAGTVEACEYIDSVPQSLFRFIANNPGG